MNEPLPPEIDSNQIMYTGPGFDLILANTTKWEDVVREMFSAVIVPFTQVGQRAATTLVRPVSDTGGCDSRPVSAVADCALLSAY